MTRREHELIDRLVSTLERIQLDDYLEYISNRRRMLANHFVYGVMRGLGFAVGFSVLSALIVMLLRWLAAENIPIIGNFLAEVIHAIEERM